MVEVKVVGKDYNYFIKKLFNLNIFYNNMYVKNNILYFKTDYNSFLKLKNQKGIYKVSINKRFDFIYLLEEIKHNNKIYIMIFLCIIYLLFLNSLIFKIEFDTDDKIIKNTIIKELKDNNIKLLKIKPSSYKLEKIKKNLLVEFRDKIEWLEIDTVGNKIVISYVTKKEKEIINDNSNRSIIAKKNAIIRKIISSKGIVIKNKNEYVNKGEEIISGNIIKDDIIISQTSAEGKVYGEIWYKNIITYPIYQKEKKYYNKTKYNIYINFFNFNKKMYNNYDSNSKKINILKNEIIPINIYIKKDKKFYYKIKKNGKDKLISLALDYLDNNINKKLDEKEYIIDKKVLNLSYKESKIKLEVLYKIYEDITDYKILDSNMINQKIEIN